MTAAGHAGDRHEGSHPPRMAPRLDCIYPREACAEGSLTVGIRGRLIKLGLGLQVEGRSPR